MEKPKTEKTADALKAAAEMNEAMGIRASEAHIKRKSQTTKTCPWWRRWFCREPISANGLDWSCMTCRRCPAPNVNGRSAAYE